MAGFDPAIHVLLRPKTWMPGTRAGHDARVVVAVRLDAQIKSLSTQYSIAERSVVSVAVRLA